MNIDIPKGIFEELFDLMDSVISHVDTLDSLELVASHYSLQKSDIDSILDYLKSKSMNVLMKGKAKCRNILFLYKKYLATRHIIDGKNIDDQKKITRLLMRFDIEINEFYTDNLFDIPTWKELIRIAHEYLFLYKKHSDSIKNHGNHEVYDLEMSKEIMRAKSIMWLMENGYDLSLEYGLPKHDPALHAKIAEDINDKIHRVGGLRVLTILCSMIGILYDHKLCRYKLARTATAMRPISEQQIPFGYLFRVALRNLTTEEFRHSAGGFSYSVKEIHDILQLAKHYIALYDLQPTSIYEIFNLDLDFIIDSLMSYAQYDKIILVEQMNYNHALRIAENLFKKWSKHEFEDGVSFKKCIEIMQIVFQYRLNRSNINDETLSQPDFFRISDLRRFSSNKFSEKVMNTVLNDVFSIRHDEIYKDYVKPEDIPDARNDGAFRPLISFEMQSETWYLSLHPSLMAIPFLESLMSVLRKSKDIRIDEEIGKEIESFTRREFLKHGISVKYGKYNFPEHESECDNILESNSKVIFIEAKKKPLTRKAKSGEPLHILLDLVQCLIESLLQGVKHELMLLKHDVISLTNDDGNVSIIEYKKRDIFIFSQSFLDYGALSTHIMLNNIVKLFLNSKFYAPPEVETLFPSVRNALKKINESALNLKNIYNEIMKFKSEEKQPSFANARFYSTPMMLAVLDSISATRWTGDPDNIQVQKNEKFLQNLIFAPMMNNGSSDFYMESRLVLADT